MVFKLMQSAEKKWRILNGRELLPNAPGSLRIREFFSSLLTRNIAFWFDQL